MSNNAMLIDYYYCDGCHSCEMACKMEKGLPEGRFGIKVNQIGPWVMEDGKWQLDYLPAPTNECDLCAARVAQGKMPSCLQHCQANIISIGTGEEMAELAKGKKKAVVYLL